MARKNIEIYGQFVILLKLEFTPIRFIRAFQLKYSKFESKLIIIINYNLFGYLIAEHEFYQNQSLALLGELQTIIPEARVELASFITLMRSHEKSSNTEGVPGLIKYLEELEPRVLACMIETFYYNLAV